MLNRLCCSPKSAQAKVLALHQKGKLLICTRTMFDFWICTIQNGPLRLSRRAFVYMCSCLAFKHYVSHGVRKVKCSAERRGVRNLILPATQSIHCCQTEARACHCEHIINQLFMERSQERFNLPLLSN